MKIRLKRERSPYRRASLLVLAAALAALSLACAGTRAYRGGQHFSDKGDWDMAVARFTKALN